MKKYLTLILALMINSISSTSFGQTSPSKNIPIGIDTLSYYDSGNGKTTLLFIHGAFINKEYWDSQLSYFTPNYRVVAIDLAGHANSTHNRNDWTIQKYGEDINELIEKLSLKNVIIIGHSIGADIMLEAAHNNNPSIIGTVGIDYFKNVGVELPKNIVDQTMTGLKNDFANTNEFYAKKALLTPKTNATITKKVITDFREMNPKVGVALNESGFNYTKRETELLKNLKTKLYLINVNYFPTNEENLKKFVGKNYGLNIINGTCHFPMLEHPKEFNSLLEKTVLEIKATK